MADDPLLAPPTWDDIEKDSSFQSLDPMGKMQTLNNWSGYTKKYFQQQGLWDDEQNRKAFGDSIKAKAAEYGNQPVTYEQATRVSREAEAADNATKAAQPKSPLDLVTGLAGQLGAQERTRALQASMMVPTPVSSGLAEADFKDVPVEKRSLYEQKAHQAKAWDEGQIPAFSLEGNVYVQPELSLNNKTYAEAVDSTDASPEEKQKAIANFPEVQKRTADQMLSILKDTSEFKNFQENNPLDYKYGNDSAAQLQDYLTKSKELGSYENIRASLGQIGLGAKLGWQQTAQSVYGVGRAAAQLVPGEGPIQDTLQDVGEQSTQEANRLSQQSQLIGGAKPLADITAGVESSALPLLAGGATGIAMRGLSGMKALTGAARLVERAGGPGFAGSVAGSGFQQFGQSYLQAMEDYQNQGLSQNEAANKAFVPAVATGLSTAIVTAVGGKYGAESLFREETKNEIKKTLLGVTKEIGIDVGAEAAEEFVDQLNQGIVEKLTTNPDKDPSEIVNQAVYAGVIGGVSGGLFGAAHQAGEAISPERVKKNIQTENMVDAAQVAQQSGAPLVALATLEKAKQYHAEPDTEEASAAFDEGEEEAPVTSQESFAPPVEEQASTEPVAENPVTEPESIVEQANEPEAPANTPVEAATETPEPASRVVEPTPQAEATTPEAVRTIKAGEPVDPSVMDGAGLQGSRVVKEVLSQPKFNSKGKLIERGSIIGDKTSQDNIDWMRSKVAEKEAAKKAQKPNAQEAPTEEAKQPEPNAPAVESPAPSEPASTEGAVATPEAESAKGLAPQKSYDDAQKKIEDIEDRLEKEGVNVYKLYNPSQKGGEILEDAGWKPMPPELAQAYNDRDAIGAKQLQTNIDDVTAALKKGGFTDGEIKRILDKYALDSTSPTGQKMAADHTLKIAKQPREKQAADIAAFLAVERGKPIDDHDDLRNLPQEVKDGAKAVQIIQSYFGITPKEKAKLSNEPTTTQPEQPTTEVPVESVQQEGQSEALQNGPPGSEKFTPEERLERINLKPGDKVQGTGRNGKPTTKFFTILGKSEITPAESFNDEIQYDVQDKNGKIQRRIMWTDLVPTKPKTPPKNEKPIQTAKGEATPTGGTDVQPSMRDGKKGGTGGFEATRLAREKKLRESAEQHFSKASAEHIDYSKLAALQSHGVFVTFDPGQKNKAGIKDGNLVLNLDAATLEGKSEDRIKAVVEEEVAHAAQYIVFRDQWEKEGSKGTLQKFIREKTLELRNDLNDAYNKASEKEKPEIERVLVAAHNIYFHDFDNDTEAVTNFGELVDALNEGDAANERARKAGEEQKFPDTLQYIIELTRMLHQLREKGRISERTLKSFAEATAKWVKRVFAHFKEGLKQFVDEGLLSQTKAAQFIRDFDAILKGAKPSDKLLNNEKPAIESFDDLLAKEDPEDRPKAAAQVASKFAPLTPEQAKLVEDNQELAYKMANRYRNITGVSGGRTMGGKSYGDLQQEAVMAMMAASRNYDPSKGPFGNFAARYISNALKTLAVKQARRFIGEYQSSVNEPDVTGNEKIQNVPAPQERESPDASGIDKAMKVIAGLPERERRILEMVAQGMSLRNISEALKPDYDLSHFGVDKIYKRTALELRKQLAEQGINSRDDVFPDTNERTQYVPERKGAEQDEAEVIEKAATDVYKDSEGTAPEEATDEDEEESKAAAREDNMRSFAREEDAKHPEYKGEGLLSAAGKWNKEIFDLLQGKEQNTTAALNNIQFLHKSLQREIKKAEKAGNPASRETINTALGNTDNALTDSQYKEARSIADPVERQSFELTAKLENQAQARKAQEEAFSSLPPTIQPIVSEMRQKVDQLSQKMVDTGAISSDMAATVGDNLGLYLHRSYSIFDNPEAWREFIKSDDPEATRIRNRAESMFRGNAMGQAAYEVAKQARKNGAPITKQQAMDAVKDLDYTAQVQNMLDDYLSIADEGSRSFLSGSLPGAKNRNILKRRGQIPEQIRQLWGEQKDATVNFAKTFGSMASYLENQNFLNKVLKEGLITAENPNGYIWKDGVSPTTRPVGYKELVTQGNKSMDPLNGAWVPPELKEAFETYYQGKKDQTFTRIIQAATALAMTAKTSLSIASTLRNFTGNILFMVGNGHFNLSELGNAGSATWANLVKKGDREKRDYIKKLIQLGVVSDNVTPGLIRELAERSHVEQFGKKFIKGNEVAPSVRDADNAVLEKVWNMAKAVGQKSTDIYGSVDDFWKVYAFENEISKLQNAYPDATREQLEKKAAQNVRETIPTYSLAYDITKKFRSGPGTLIAPFITFTSEVLRTTIGTLRTGINEIKSDNPAVQRIGYQRLTGFALAQSIIPAIKMAVKWALGYDDEDENSLRQFLPEWQKDAQIIMLKKDAKGNSRFIDVSFLNPYSVLTEPFGAMYGAMQGNKGVAQNSLDAAKDGLSRALAPLLSEQIFAGAFMDSMRNTTASGQRVYNPQDTTANISRDIMGHLWQAFEPGTITSLRRIFKAGTGQVGASGRAYDLGAEISSMTLGQRISTYDPKQGLDASTRPFKRNNQDATQLFTRPFNSRGTMNLLDVSEGYKNANAAKMRNLQQLRDYYKAAITLGVPPEDAKVILNTAEIGKKNTDDVIQGIFRRYNPEPAVVNKVNQSHPERVQALEKAQSSIPDIQQLR